MQKIDLTRLENAPHGLHVRKKPEVQVLLNILVGSDFEVGNDDPPSNSEVISGISSMNFHKKYITKKAFARVRIFSRGWLVKKSIMKGSEMPIISRPGQSEK